MKFNITDTQAIKRCLELAMKGVGCVSPNPLVGAFIIKDGEIISEGWHNKYGDIHAEIDAINKAVNKGISNFSDLIIAINLEPCFHFGKQPPCVDTIIEKKFKRVIIGMHDPNPVVSGRSIKKLKDAGIEVNIGVLEDDCKWINRFFCKYIVKKEPFIIMKVAQSIDGCIATEKGESKWITCEESRRRTHILRSEVDAILVGIDTVLIDNPLLNIRYIDSNSNPAIIILDSNLRIPLDANLVQYAKERKIIIVYINDNPEKEYLLKKFNVILIKAIKNKNNCIDIKDAIKKITIEYKFISILVEGGAKIFSSFINENLVDELNIFIAPMIIGNGKKAFENVYTEKLDLTAKFRIAGSIQSDIDEQILLIKK